MLSTVLLADVVATAHTDTTDIRQDVSADIAVDTDTDMAQQHTLVRFGRVTPQEFMAACGQTLTTTTATCGTFIRNAQASGVIYSVA